MAAIAVFHLVRRENGVRAFEQFLASYCRYRPGVCHELVVIYKGFPLRATRAYRRLVADIPHRQVHVADYGFDLRPYFEAVRKFDYRYFCFLNSFSRILDDDWLAKLYRWITADGVGVVGATGSYESFYSNYVERANMLGGLDGASRMRWKVRHLFEDRHPRVFLQRTLGLIVEGRSKGDPRRGFPQFPNFHIRTNAFMASRATLLQIQVGPILTKWSAYAVESGRDSLTNQILQLGLKPLVVTRAGEAFEKERWHLSNTFRQDRQQDLLIADTQTEAYAMADPESRAILSRRAWGNLARPA